MEVKYKHKQTGEVVTQSKTQTDYYYPKNHSAIHKRFIENTDDWELVVEEVVGWLVNDKYPKWLRYKGVDITFGISSNGWFCHNETLDLDTANVLASPETTLKMLSEYATQLGYKEGAMIKTRIDGINLRLNGPGFHLVGNDLFLGSFCIMKDGIWVTIIKEPSSFTEKQLSELNEMINKKLKL